MMHLTYIYFIFFKMKLIDEKFVTEMYPRVSEKVNLIILHSIDLTWATVGVAITKLSNNRVTHLFDLWGAEGYIVTKNVLSHFRDATLHFP